MIDQADATPDDDRVIDVRRGRRPGAAWSPVARGLHRTGGPGLLEDLRAWQTIMRPAAAFTHLTGAQARGWWLPPLPAGLPVWITQTKLQHASRRSGLVVIRRRGVPPSELVDGVRLAPPAETLVTCAIDLSLLDLVVLIDSALHRGDVTVDALVDVAAQHRRGAPRLRLAIPYADRRSESAWESLLRVLHAVCGIDVEPQKELHAAEARSSPAAICGSSARGGSTSTTVPITSSTVSSGRISSGPGASTGRTTSVVGTRPRTC